LKTLKFNWSVSASDQHADVARPLALFLLLREQKNALLAARAQHSLPLEAGQGVGDSATLTPNVAARVRNAFADGVLELFAQGCRVGAG